MTGSWDPTALAWWVITGFSCRNRIVHTCPRDLLWPVGSGELDNLTAWWLARAHCRRRQGLGEPKGGCLFLRAVSSSSINNTVNKSNIALSQLWLAPVFISKRKRSPARAAMPGCRSAPPGRSSR